MVNNYSMGHYSYPLILTKIQNILANWSHSARTTLRPPPDSLYFAQESANYKRVTLTNYVDRDRICSKRKQIDVFDIKFTTATVTSTN